MKCFWKGFSTIIAIGFNVLVIMAVVVGFLMAFIQFGLFFLTIFGDVWGTIIMCFGFIFLTAVGVGLYFFFKERKALKELERAELWLGVCTTEWEHITNDPKCSKAKADEVYHKVQAAKIQRRKCLERLEEIRNYF